MSIELTQASAPAGTVGRIGGQDVSRPGYLNVTLAGRPESVQVVRALLRRTLGPHATPDLLICASELATNAIEHTRSGLPGGRFLVTAQAESADVVLVSVLDEGARTPQDRPALGLPEEHGRGLGIVGAFSISSGDAPLAAGRLAWFRISVCDAAAGGSNRDARHDGAHDGHRDAALSGGRYR